MNHRVKLSNNGTEMIFLDELFSDFEENIILLLAIRLQKLEVLYYFFDINDTFVFAILYTATNANFKLNFIPAAVIRNDKK